MDLFKFSQGSHDVEPAQSSSSQVEDWSLRANGRVYFDRQNETDRLLNRIRNSSATVTGIAGLRGAGKSSLAMRVLDKCEKEDQAFTLLVHSPTSYEAKDFLISVFQRCCEDVVRRIDAVMGQAETLKDRGVEEVTRYSRKFWALAIGAIVILTTLLWYILDTYQDLEAASFAESVRQEEELSKQEISIYETRLRQLVSDLYPRFFAEWGNLPIDQQSISDLMRYVKTDEAMRALEQTDVDIAFVEGEISEILARLAATKDRHQSNAVTFESEFALGRITFSFELLALAISSVFAYVFVLIGGRETIRVTNLHKVAKKYPIENGLRAAAQDLLQTLQFQSKTTISAEAKVGISKLTGSLGRQRSLEARPLSLPGLTAEFGRFLEQVSEVYNGKVVICLDELDKIEDIEDLSSLLRAVKGVLGHKNTHFMLTVSEDALARYSTRRRMDRGMLESSFESIIFLDRIKPQTATRMLKAMGVLVGEDPEDAKRAFVMWASAAGIPREIKRGAVSVRQQEVSLSEITAQEIWARLVRDNLEDLKLWGKRLDLPEEKVFTFLTLLQKVETFLDEAHVPALSKLKVVSAHCKEFEDSVLAFFEDPDASILVDQAERYYGLVRAGLEIRLQVFTLQALSQLELENEEFINQMLEIFDAIPTNVLFARELLYKIEATVTDQSATAHAN